MTRRTILLILTIQCLCPAIARSSDPVFVDWTSVDTDSDVAEGYLFAVPVSLAGFDINYGVTDGSSTVFNAAVFTPPLESSDCVGILGAPETYSYVFTFSSSVNNPIIHLRSLASTLTFSADSIVRLSGDPDFVVIGNAVSGVIDDDPIGYDANGTIIVSGTFTSLLFTASYPYIPRDGIYIQVGTDTDPLSSVTVDTSTRSTDRLSVAPNPCAGKTTLFFGTDVNGPVRATVFDHTGRMVRLLLDGNLSPGPHSLRWDGRDDQGRPVATGIYLARVSAMGHAHGGQLTLIR